MAYYDVPPAYYSYMIPDISPTQKALIEKLHPTVKSLCYALIKECKRQGITIQIVSGLRPIEEQARLYALGRDSYGNVIDPTKVVTNAKPGGSYHNYGLAFDFCINMSGRSKYDPALVSSVGAIGKHLIGLRWGGDFKTFKDSVHFEWSNGLTIRDLLAGKRP